MVISKAYAMRFRQNGNIYWLFKSTILKAMKENICCAWLKSCISMDRSVGNHANKVNPGANSFTVNFSLQQLIFYWLCWSCVFVFLYSICVLILIVFPSIFQSLCWCAKLCNSIFENGWAEKPEWKSKLRLDDKSFTRPATSLWIFYQSLPIWGP